MAFSTTNLRFSHRTFRKRAERTHLNPSAQTEYALVYLGRENHVWTGICAVNPRYWAFLTQSRIPISFSRFIVDQAAFLMIAAAIIIPEKIRTLKSVWRFHS
jgi:hypothetical protein